MTNEIVKADPSTAIKVTTEQVALVKATLCPNATDPELALLVYECQRHGVHPLDGLIRMIPFADKDGNRRPTFITSIDFLRARAEKTGLYRGQDDVEYSDEKIEIDKTLFPVWAKSTVRKLDPESGTIYTVSATVRAAEYYPGEKKGKMYREKPYLMVGKCAEALALRKAFPVQLAGLYAVEEMQAAENLRPAGRAPSSGSAEDAATKFWTAMSRNKIGGDKAHEILDRVFGFKSMKDIPPGRLDEVITKIVAESKIIEGEATDVNDDEEKIKKVVIPYGDLRGRPLSELADADLAKMIKYYSGEGNKKPDPNFADRDRITLAALARERELRLGGRGD